MLGLNRPIRDRPRSGRSSGGLWQGCYGRWHTMSNCLEISSLCWQTGSLLMQFDGICHFTTASGNSQRRILCPLEPAPVSDIM